MSRPRRILSRLDLAEPVGVDRAADRPVRNTDQFLRGLPSSHDLLLCRDRSSRSGCIAGQCVADLAGCGEPGPGG